MTRPEKSRVRSAFERAANSYDAAASVQQRICQELLARLPASVEAPQTLLDAGCGTGFALNGLKARFPSATPLALDFSRAMLARLDPRDQRVQADLEHLPLASQCIDLYWSSLAVQWCDLRAVLCEARRVLSENGLLALATLGPATFGELRHAFAGVDSHRHTIAFHSAAAIGTICSEAGLTAVDLRIEQETAHYPDFRALLKAVKAVGANQLGDGRRTSLLGKTAFQQAESAIETLRTADGLPLTYDVIYLYARPSHQP